MISTVKKKYYLNHIRSKLKEVTATRTMLNFKESRTIGLLFNGTDKNVHVQVEKFAESLKKKKKSVKSIAFVDSKTPTESIEFPYFSRNDLNWFEIPSSDLVKDFIHIKFDILINLCTTESLPLEYISAVSASKFRIGRYNKEKTYCYDFMINNTKNASMTEFIADVKHFLETINANG